MVFLFIVFLLFGWLSSMMKVLRKIWSYKLKLERFLNNVRHLRFLKTGLTEASTYVPLRWLIRGLLLIVNIKQYNLLLFCSHEVIFHTVVQGRLFLKGWCVFVSVTCLSKAFMFLIFLVLQGMLDHVWRMSTGFVTAWVISLATEISMLCNKLRLWDWKGYVRTACKTCLKWSVSCRWFPFPCLINT